MNIFRKLVEVDRLRAAHQKYGDMSLDTNGVIARFVDCSVDQILGAHQHDPAFPVDWGRLAVQGQELPMIRTPQLIATGAYDLLLHGFRIVKQPAPGRFSPLRNSIGLYLATRDAPVHEPLRLLTVDNTGEIELSAGKTESHRFSTLGLRAETAPELIGLYAEKNLQKLQVVEFVGFQLLQTYGIEPDLEGVAAFREKWQHEAGDFLPTHRPAQAWAGQPAAA